MLDLLERKRIRKTNKGGGFQSAAKRGRAYKEEAGRARLHMEINALKL
jgi:hypothetical protein